MGKNEDNKTIIDENQFKILDRMIGSVDREDILLALSILAENNIELSIPRQSALDFRMKLKGLRTKAYELYTVNHTKEIVDFYNKLSEFVDKMQYLLDDIISKYFFNEQV